MTLSASRSPRSATGRAELLRALAIRSSSNPTYLALEHSTEGWFGFVHRDDARPLPPAQLDLHKVAPTPEAIRRLPLLMPSVPMIVRRETRQTPEPATPPSQPAGVEPLAENDPAAQARSSKRLVHFEALVPAARLLPALRRHLGATRNRAIDISRLIDRLVTGALPARLPYLRRPCWHPELVVVLDFSARLWPYRADLHGLAERMLQLCGRSGLSLRIIERGPLGPWSDWCAHQDEHLAHWPPDLPWRMPAPGTPVLLVSDLGMLLGPDSPAYRSWVQFIDRLRSHQVRPVALVPLGAEQLHARICAQLPVLRWSPDAPPHPVRAQGQGETNPQGLNDLLAMVAATRRTDPPLLREMRKLNPVAPLNAGLEGALWCHPQVVVDTSATIRSECAAPHLQRFSELMSSLQLRLHELRRQHHAHFRAVLEHEETLLWAAHSKIASTKTQTNLIDDALHFMERLTALLKTSGGDAGVWLQVANGIVQRADRDMAVAFIRNGRRILDELLTSVMIAQGGRGRAPAWADPARMPAHAESWGWLVRDARSGELLLQAEAAGRQQTALGEPIRMDHGVRIRRNRFDYLLHARALPHVLGRLDDAVDIELLTARESLTVATVARPRGACGWSVSSGGLQVQAAGIIGDGITWSDSDLSIHAGTGRVIGNVKSIAIGKHRIEYGIDESFGIYADLHLATRHGYATQRLRWIEPGTFLMGSPDTEPEQYGDEGPQHPVTLTQGFWLADTACTQALWQAVTGNNPSRFQDDVQNPVDNVSWNNVQPFLRALEALLPGSEARLPTEAQWEYACRAGTTTAFSFGTQITPEQVNYAENYPYAGGKKGEYRQRTLPVKSLPANAWGLYEMHGNVWEWCADDQRIYEAPPQQDPERPADGSRRALRGGSWDDDARRARSASRLGYDPGYRRDYLGFRLCLRSSSPVRPGGPGQARRPEGDMPAVPARDAPAPSLAQRAKKIFSRSEKPGGDQKP